MADEFLRKRRETEEHISKKGTSVNNLETTKLDTSLKDSKLLFGLIVFRVCNVFLVQTWFVPDEFWQAPEVAHNIAFGYGHLTWEWREGIRGFTYPLLFAVPFKVLEIFRLDYPTLVIYSPRVIQAIFGAVGEYHIYKLARLLYGNSAAWWVLFCQVTSWFMFYCITRTLTNSMETALISIGLYYWEFSEKIRPGSTSEINLQNSAIYKALVLASLSCLVRPTAMVIWVPLGVARLWKVSPVHFLLIFVLPTGLFSLIFSILTDSYFYRKFVLVQYNFLYFNIMQNIGELYGTHPWHWYFTQGVPAVLGSHLAPLAIGLYSSGKCLQKWLLLIVIDVTVFSFLGHKEFRFILPVVPMAMLISGRGLHYIATTDSSVNVKKHDDNSIRDITHISFKGKLLAIFLIVTNIPVALYIGLVHQRGTLDVMRALNEKVETKTNDAVWFLMPCHSTPYYSYMHSKVDMRFLDCSPNQQPGYIDEADLFYNNPQSWLDVTFKNRKELLPSHLVFFDVLFKDIELFLKENSYSECGRYFYSHFPSGRLGRTVCLFCKMDHNK
ncbi:GPI mannosyltransferase 3-like [Dendronephthya gigantea]|uniref:GPI mannosyltransferase 3-like n=1 Tax=Dendronephthya gigantea TaxID=151771 RepID=UPI00106D1DBF|nr:GPI mannosyltransferase 3-like [Dendronephthya gigantea]